MSEDWRDKTNTNTNKRVPINRLGKDILGQAQS